MTLFPGITHIITLVAAILSLHYVAPPPAISVEAFYLTSPITSRLSLQQVPHRNNRPLELLPEKVTKMPLTISKGTNSDDNASSSLPPSSKLDVIITGIGSTTSFVVAGTFFFVLCYKRDSLMISFFLGAIANAIFGKVLKKFLNIERPGIADEGDAVCKIDRPNDNGMPSSHGMSVGFICTFVALLLPNTTIPLLIYAAISLSYRVKVNLHTVDQIAVGALLGTFDGAAWWYLCTDGFRGVNVIDLVSSSGIMNEYGRLPWYLLTVPAIIGSVVVGKVERRLVKLFRSGSSEETRRTTKHE